MFFEHFVWIHSLRPSQNSALLAILVEMLQNMQTGLHLLDRKQKRQFHE